MGMSEWGKWSQMPYQMHKKELMMYNILQHELSFMDLPSSFKEQTALLDTSLIHSFTERKKTISHQEVSKCCFPPKNLVKPSSVLCTPPHF